MKRVFIAALAVLALSGCSTNSEGSTDVGGIGEAKAYNIDLPDGGSVVCVVFDGYNRGGIDCDFGDSA